MPARRVPRGSGPTRVSGRTLSPLPIIAGQGATTVGEGVGVGAPVTVAGQVEGAGLLAPSRAACLLLPVLRGVGCGLSLRVRGA